MLSSADRGRDSDLAMEKAALLENLREAKGHAHQSKANAEAQKKVIAALIAIGKDPAGAERILEKLETAQTDDLSEIERLLNLLEGEPS